MNVSAAYSFYQPDAIPMPKGDGATRIGTCGDGTEWQANLHHYSKESIQLFHVPAAGEQNHFRELARMAEKFNRKLNRKGMKLVRKLREKTGDPTMEITVHLSRKGFVLCYAARSPKGRPAEDALYGPARGKPAIKPPTPSPRAKTSA